MNITYYEYKMNTYIPQNVITDMGFHSWEFAVCEQTLDLN